MVEACILHSTILCLVGEEVGWGATTDRFHQAQDMTPLVLGADLHKGEAGHASLGAEEDSAEEHHRIRLVALVVTTSSEDHASWVCVR